VRFERGLERLLPRWVVTFFVGGAVVLIPWIVLMFTVPQVVNVSRRWELVWGGFDCFLVLGFAVTAFRLITRSPRGAVTAAMTGTMLLVDAWFDVLTTHRGGQIISILMAVFAEIPCALICFYVSRRIMGVFEQAKEYLGSAGFRVRGGQLVPPANFPAPTAAPCIPSPTPAPVPNIPASASEPSYPSRAAARSSNIPASAPEPNYLSSEPNYPSRASTPADAAKASPALRVLPGNASAVSANTPVASASASVSTASAPSGDTGRSRVSAPDAASISTGFDDPAGGDVPTSVAVSRDLAA